MPVGKFNFGKSRGIIKLIGSAASQLVWPAGCSTCGRLVEEQAGGLCEKCWEQVRTFAGGDYCGRCGLSAGRFAIADGKCSNCRELVFKFDAIARAGVYAGALARAVVGFKNGHEELESLMKMLAVSAFESCVFRDEIEMFVPVPLHWIRRAGRGFNQAQTIARFISPRRGRIVCDLARVRNTGRQPSVNYFQRAQNVRGAFALRYGHKFKDRVICLVDDVKTSGATLNECGRLLRQGGAKKVYALVVAVSDPNFKDSR